MRLYMSGTGTRILVANAKLASFDTDTLDTQDDFCASIETDNKDEDELDCSEEEHVSDDLFGQNFSRKSDEIEAMQTAEAAIIGL